MTVKSVVQAAQLVPLEKEDIHKTIREEITNRDDVTAHCWAQLLRMYAEGNDDWVGAIWRKVVEEISSNDDGKATAIILNALARSHSKQAHIRYLKLPDMNSSSKWDVHSVAICCISLARLAQTQDVIGAVEVDDMFAQLEGFLITKVDLSRSSNLLQLKQLALGFSLVYMEKVSNTLWKSIAVAAMDGRVPGSGEDRIGVLGSLSVGYPLGKATREIESLARTIIDVVDLTKVNQRSFHLLVMKLVKMRYFPVEVMSKVEACIEQDPDRIIPNGEALLSLVHFLFACNSDHAELWRIAMAKLDVLYDGMTTEDLFASVGFMTTCNRRPSDQVADDVLSRLSEPSDHYQALMASMALCRADLALQLPVHEVAMKILVSMRSTKLHTDTLQECVNMLCQVALLSGSPQLMQQIINDLTRFPLRNTNMSWLAWSAAMLNSLNFIPMALLRSMLRVNLNYRHPVAGFCRDSRMAQRVQETLICVGGGFSTEAERGGFQIDFVSDYQSVV
ncbi:hypothetical protein Pmar_PMAR015205 [Perkinsus marinus ATCC 50983]|uniref:Uncharacterized protein n=1 Tax=Perkinsus marinus (strain ATCC 50983 / TXsc) TaxID=423536 RepID=C5K5P9_PERM5|nr:hypothetical protein Pmar_PMAR015205 [Perkinsus marinus ATCC 50983]EER20206.1 hypothetical protein Pmar_PMAR015205 [Perkinsus marinus ATCC 50983]|eukprot:XP_002788410.1 hypothetical protein Pmar_PMAR015205 [Perkinsus marinus ATCC 50983]